MKRPKTRKQTESLCERCGYAWWARVRRSVECPSCKSKKWAEKKVGAA